MSWPIIPVLNTLLSCVSNQLNTANTVGLHITVNSAI